ncbi:phosphoribosylformylglycinamidine cyclo-ligase [Marinithermus hydrothermalis]|uniref:Phosphoribosylformylglycinamidine cyclo-ligase n=1 Tax=Marinithermus hydrothermalis (strain DSM 14884 / JCM 11576 / T1) TaxID=869210 RepID=F2NR84_MARHT|nr:phosphoribosylformylglycinamidine cyclo-ligase [Marinithermus hydrothermalis]AEB12933.1 phosphoribosylformylglycinamidine cyclo-ligase [Marinithermus hydrothermalis DSM 14884]
MKYEDAGVNINRKANALKAASEHIRATYTPEVLWGLGAFGGLFDVKKLKDYAHPVLVASTDGVGTKTLLAAKTGRWEGIGFDIVNHSINDILVQGARPLFFLDYVASSRLEPEVLGAVLDSLAAACQAAGIPLLGGETAEMPGVYHKGGLDLVGTIVGVVERDRIVDGRRTQSGDVILALPSSGLHTNGYSLARKAFETWNLSEPLDELGGKTLADALLEPHRSYLEPVTRLLEAGLPVHAMAHITGGGVEGNLPRVLPEGLGAVIEKGTWPVPPIFPLIQRAGHVSEAEMYRVFNMGLGFLVVLPEAHAEEARQALGEAYPVGRIVEGEGVAFR